MSVVVVLAQDDTNETSSIKQYNVLKIGASAQVNINFGNYGYYDSYYYGGYYYDDFISESGGNEHIFLAYEHVWDFTESRTAIGIEPQIGVSIYNHYNRKLTTGYGGVNLRFYWLSKPNFRMGMATYFGYTYANGENTVSVPMAGGAYYQNRQVTTHYSQFSGDISLIPFQFRLKGAPVTIGSQFALFGLNVTRISSDRYNTGYNDDYSYRDVVAGIYALKFELKIGYEF